MMKIYSYIIILNCLIFITQEQVNAQDVSNDEMKTHVFDLGIGIGLDYGGLIGTKLSYIFPSGYVSTFGAVGLYFGKEIAWNMGTAVYFIPQTDQHIFRPYMKFMYGINRYISIVGKEEFDGSYKGFTPGFGLEFMFGKRKLNGFDINLNLPIGGAKYRENMREIEQDPNIEITYLIPIAISVGYHREF